MSAIGQGWLGDLRHGVRVLAGAPLFAIAAIATLGLGIGANTALFSVVDAILVRPLPYAHGDRLVVLRQRSPKANIDDLGFSVAEVNDYRERCRSLDALAEHHTMNFILLGRSEPERVRAGVVSSNMFDLLGVKLLMGRGLVASDEAPGAPPVIVLAHHYWQEEHGGDPAVVGKSFRMNDREHVVVGVLPSMPQWPDRNDVYMPTTACPTRSSQRFIDSRTARMMTVVARLAPGVEVSRAEADVSKVARQLETEHPDAYPENAGYAASVLALEEELSRTARPTFVLLLATSAFVLLVACANVANLLLARIVGREREAAIRLALGASRLRLLRQLVTETTLLALCGGVVGVAIAAWSLPALASFAARFTTRAEAIALDSRALAFTLVVALACGLVFGALPALAASSAVADALKKGNLQATPGVSRHRLRKLLVVGQVSLSFTLVIGAMLMARSFVELHRVEAGFDPENVLSVTYSPNWSRVTTAQAYRDLHLAILQDVETQPGVVAAAVAPRAPLTREAREGGPYERVLRIEGRASQEIDFSVRADFRTVTPRYFDVVGVPILSGRGFTDADSESAPKVALVSVSLARRHWPGADPLGARVAFGRQEDWATVVGIVGDVRQYGLGADPVDAVYVPVAQQPGGSTIVVRARRDPLTLAAQVRAAVHRHDPEAAITSVETLEQARSESLAPSRLTAVLLGAFAAIALAITATGIGAVLALWVGQRTRELGVRLAIGAWPGSILWMVVRQGLVLVGIAIPLGIAGALALGRSMRTLLFGVAPTDPVSFALVGLVLLVVASIACLLPAIRATRIQPMDALRCE
jgi:putative ABC transport system permease protein